MALHLGRRGKSPCFTFYARLLTNVILNERVNPRPRFSLRAFLEARRAPGGGCPVNGAELYIQASHILFS
jgi:hypothetical protein